MMMEFAASKLIGKFWRLVETDSAQTQTVSGFIEDMTKAHQLQLLEKAAEIQKAEKRIAFQKDLIQNAESKCMQIQLEKNERMQDIRRLEAQKLVMLEEKQELQVKVDNFDLAQASTLRKVQELQKEVDLVSRQKGDLQVLITDLESRLSRKITAYEQLYAQATELESENQKLASHLRKQDDETKEHIRKLEVQNSFLQEKV
jgi:chromosome segregation ATPase